MDLQKISFHTGSQFLNGSRRDGARLRPFLQQRSIAFTCAPMADSLLASAVPYSHQSQTTCRRAKKLSGKSRACLPSASLSTKVCLGDLRPRLGKRIGILNLLPNTEQQANSSAWSRTPRTRSFPKLSAHPTPVTLETRAEMRALRLPALLQAQPWMRLLPVSCHCLPPSPAYRLSEKVFPRCLLPPRGHCTELLLSATEFRL